MICPNNLKNSLVKNLLNQKLATIVGKMKKQWLQT
jgi:hypothetical protein